MAFVLLAMPALAGSAAKTSHRAARHQSAKNRSHAKSQSKAKNGGHAKKRAKPKSGRHSSATSSQPVVLARPDQYALLATNTLAESSANGVLANDSDSARDTLSVDKINGRSALSTTTVGGGTVSMSSNGSFTYDPSAKLATLASGSIVYDWFTYQATDARGGSATASVLIVIVGTFVPPSVSNVESSTLAYDAGTPPVAVSSALTLSAPSDATLAGATVKLGSGFVAGEDVLSFANQNGITGSYDAATGVLALSGTASVADYQAALRSVTYSDPDGANPTTGDRTVSFQVNDGRSNSNLSNTASRTVDVAPNPPPTAAPMSASTGYQTPTDIDVLSSASDTDGDTLSVASVDTTGTKGKVSINPDGTIHYDPNGQFNSLQYGQSASDSFTYKVSDGFHDSSSAKVTVTVTGPTLPPPALSNVETTTLSYDAGTPPVAVSSTLTASSAVTTTFSGATVSIGSGFASSEDVLGFTNQNGITGSYDSGTGVLTLSGTASVADYQAALRSVTFSDPDGSSPTTGNRTISFQLNDGESVDNLSNTESRTLDVEPNPVPTAADFSASTGKHSPVVIAVLTHAGDSDGDTVSLASVGTLGTVGKVTVNPDGTVTYDPNGQFEDLNEGQSAVDTFTYTVSDGFHDSAAGTVTVTINGSNDPPVLANIESSTLAYDAGTSPVQVSSALTVSDPDDSDLAGATVAITNGLTSSEDALAFTSQDGITGSYDASTGVLALTGTASLADYQAALRSVTFSDANGANPTTGERTVAFSVDDGHTSNNVSNVATRDVQVDPNPPPTANNFAVSTDKHDAITIAVLSHAGDSDGDTVSLASVDSTSTTGKVTVNPDGTVTYDPNGQFESLTAGQSAVDTFTYTVSDGFHDSSAGTVTVTVNGSDDPPVLAGVESSDLPYDAGTPAQPVSPDVTVSAPDGFATISSATVSIGLGFSAGEDVLAFTNQNGITGSYDASTGVLTLSGSASVADYQAALESVSFSDPDGANPTTGDRTVSFQVNDGRVMGNLSNTVSRTVTVAPNPPPLVADVQATTDYQTATNIDVLSSASDTDGDTLSVASVDTTGTKGKVSINPDGTIHYDPNGQFDDLQYGQSASDSFTYKVSDGYQDSSSATVTVTVTGPTTAPPALSDIESSTISYDAGTPAVPLTSSLAVSAPDGYSTLSGATVSIGSGFASSEDVLGFTNQNGITGSYDSGTGVLTLSGTASVADYQAALRSITYSDPDGSSPTTGNRTISIQVDDGRASNDLSNVVSRTVDVAPNPPPTDADVTASTGWQTATNINVLSGASDPDGEAVSVASVDTTGTQGSVSINPDGTIHYDPSGQFSSLQPGSQTTDSFTYKVTDGYTDSSAYTVTVTVTRPVAPVLADIESTPLSYRAQDPGVAITSTLTVSDKGSTTLSGATVAITAGLDSGADELSFTTQNGITASYDASTGVLTLSGDASLADYQAALQSVVFSTSDGSAAPAIRTIRFQATDSNGASSEAVGRDIDVDEANQAPRAISHDYSAVGNTPLAVGTSPSGPVASNSGSLLNGDSDSDSSDPISVSGYSDPAHGSVTVNTDGTFTYVPDAGYSGEDSFTYTIVDSNDPQNPKTATATAYISVGTVVWYVDNSQTAAGNGEAQTPFNTLAAANSAAQADSIIFLDSGDAPYTGGFSMKSGEDLYGEPYGLTVDDYTLVNADSGNGDPTITNSSGDGIDLANDVDVENVQVSNTSGNGISATNVDNATVDQNIGDQMQIEDAGGDGIYVSGGDGTLNLGYASAYDSTGHSLYISGRTGGTTTVHGDLYDNTGGIDLSSNTGATINLTGQLEVSTTSATAFSATGGGTVTVTGTGSILTSTAGTALDVENTTIGSGGLNFYEIGADGPGHGIDLTNTGTSGGLTVTGDGGTASGGDGTGGTIKDNTGSGSATSGASDGAIYLDNTADVSLTDMDIENNAANGVYGTDVSGLALKADTFTNNGASVGADDSGVRVDGLSGTSSIANTSISGSANDNARIYGPASGSLTLTVTGSTFDGPHTPGTAPDAPSCKANSTDQGDGLLVEPEDGNVTVSASNDTFKGNFSDGLAVTGAGDSSDKGSTTFTADNNTATDNCGAGIVVGDSAAGNATGSFTIDNNTVTDQQGDGIVANNFGGGTWSGHIDSNTVGSASVADSGSLAGSGIDVDDEAPDHAGTLTVDVSSNTISQIESAYGIEGTADNGAATLNLTLASNTIDTDQANSLDGITVQSGAAPNDTSVVCLNATGNTSDTAGNGKALGYDSVGMSVGEFDPTPSATFDIQGPTASDPTTIQNYLDANNTLTGTDGKADDEALAQFDGIVGIATCPTAS